jgi:hypothetical protein
MPCLQSCQISLQMETTVPRKILAQSASWGLNTLYFHTTNMHISVSFVEISPDRKRLQQIIQLWCLVFLLFWVFHFMFTEDFANEICFYWTTKYPIFMITQQKTFKTEFTKLWCERIKIQATLLQQLCTVHICTHLGSNYHLSVIISSWDNTQTPATCGHLIYWSHTHINAFNFLISIIYFYSFYTTILSAETT